MLRRSRLSSAAVVALCVLAGCGAEVRSDRGSPEAAVRSFLIEYGTAPRPGGDRAPEATAAWWRRMCDHTDPASRAALRSDRDTDADPRAMCGAMIALSVGYTGDTHQMARPDTVTGTPVGARTMGDESVVTVEMHYTVDETGVAVDPPPPATARVGVLVVKRDGAWWVATPRAFNPLHAADGGLDPATLKTDHARRFAAA